MLPVDRDLEAQTEEEEEAKLVLVIISIAGLWCLLSTKVWCAVLGLTPILIFLMPDLRDLS